MPTDLIENPERGLINRGGRPKGSKNKITLYKLMAEEAVRDRNRDRMLQVCEDIITDALNGNENCRKLVWQSVMSKSGSDQGSQGGGVPTIIVRTDRPVELHQVPPRDDPNVIDVTPEETPDVRQQADE